MGRRPRRKLVWEECYQYISDCASPPLCLSRSFKHKHHQLRSANCLSFPTSALSNSQLHYTTRIDSSRLYHHHAFHREVSCPVFSPMTTFRVFRDMTAALL